MKQYIRLYRLKIVFITLCIIVRQLLLVFAQYLNGEVFVGLVDKNMQYFIWTTVGMLMTWGIIIALDAFLHITKERVSLDMQESIRQDVATKMIETDFQTYHTYTSGHYLSWLNNDIATISQKGITQYFDLVTGLSGVTFAAVMLVQYHWSLFVTTLLGFTCMFYIPKLFNKRLYQVSSEVTEANEQFVSDMEDQLKGYPVYFAFSSLGQFIHKVKWLSQTLKKVLMKQVSLEIALMTVNFSINVLFQIVLTTIAAICYFNGWLIIGAVTIVGTLADIVFSGLGNVSYQLASMKSVKPIFDKFEQLEPEKIAAVTLVDNAPLYKATDICLTYGDETIFQQLSFEMKQGDKCLITGASGSGKSSLLQLLLGYQVDFDGSLQYKGLDIKQISSKVIAKDVYYLAQASYVFHASVQDNVTLGQDFTDAQIIACLKQVGFDEPTSMLAMHASQLSGGQKQRIALARALIRQPKILICDEITASLDKENTALIEQLLLAQTDMTLVMITHALYADKQQFDRVIAL